MRSESQNPDWGIIDLSGCDAEIFGEVASNIRRARIVHLVSDLESACLAELMCKRVSRNGVHFVERQWRAERLSFPCSTVPQLLQDQWGRAVDSSGYESDGTPQIRKPVMPSPELGQGYCNQQPERQIFESKTKKEPLKILRGSSEVLKSLFTPEFTPLGFRRLHHFC